MLLTKDNADMYEGKILDRTQHFAAGCYPYTVKRNVYGELHAVNMKTGVYLPLADQKDLCNCIYFDTVDGKIIE